ncbi:MAG TPA: alkaline phosphatase family protein [Thermoplasmata archaeon]
MKSAWVPMGLAVLTFVLVSPAGLTVSKLPPPIVGGDSSSPLQMVWGPPSTHIKHVITVIMENRDYDNYFGEYCPSIGPYCSSTGNGIPVNTCVPKTPSNLTTGCVAPYAFTTKQFTTIDIPHDWLSGGVAWNHGAMDGFYAAEGYSTETFGHYNGTTLPIYWDMAEQYAMSDNLFAANLSYSLPNHWYLIAGHAPNISQSSYLKSAADRAVYLTQSDQTRTIQDLLNRSYISWKDYDYRLPARSAAIQSGGVAYDFWNPMAAKSESYNSLYSSHFAVRGDLLNDLANGTLPQISWVVPAANQSDHPGFNLTGGESWVAQLVDAVEASPEWNTTAVFVVWDDYGGWYDHVPPPRDQTKLLSFRSPALLISPYAKQNYISHQFLTFFSLLHYLEWQFGLGCLTSLDCAAALPFDFFDFNQTARAPILFPTNWTQASYPMQLQIIGKSLPDGSLGPPCVSCVTIDPLAWSTRDPVKTNYTLGD